MQPVVTTSWLAARLGSPGLRVLDGSWYLPGSGRDAAAEYFAGHIPGAVFFDLDASSDTRSCPMTRNIHQTRGALRLVPEPS